jgi:hypothetical protein
MCAVVAAETNLLLPESPTAPICPCVVVSNPYIVFVLIESLDCSSSTRTLLLVLAILVGEAPRIIL